MTMNKLFTFIVGLLVTLAIFAACYAITQGKAWIIIPLSGEWILSKILK